jgi:hypothetical protein
MELQKFKKMQIIRPRKHRIQMMKIVLLVIIIGLLIIQNKKQKKLQSKQMLQNS